MAVNIQFWIEVTGDKQSLLNVLNLFYSIFAQSCRANGSTSSLFLNVLNLFVFFSIQLLQKVEIELKLLVIIVADEEVIIGMMFM